ncbi:MAG: 3-phosphoshikimate 1-carboxyvinyltransferase [Rikenellaceae bacterium]
MIITVKPSKIEGEILAPASKSYAQRALALSALAQGVSRVRNIDSGGDVDAVLSLIADLGATVTLEGRTATVVGGDFTGKKEQLFIGESGLATRLFTPIASIFDSKTTITGEGSILKRPIITMQQPLTDLGVRFESNNGFLPLSVCGPIKGGEIEVDGSLSSQFISGLLIALPLCEVDSVLNVKDLKSKPYIDMTLDTIKMAGVEIVNENYQKFRIKGGQKYQNFDYTVEGDWSGASCLLVAGATSGSITIKNLKNDSSQADIAILEALRRAKADIEIGSDYVTVRKSDLVGFEFDATDCPDLFPALAALAASCKGKSTIVGTKRLTHKESDRAKTIKELFAALSIEIDISIEDKMVVTGGEIKGEVSVDSCNDHRIAMAAAVAALTSTSGSVEITHAEAVNKSYSKFWNDLKSVTKNGE